MHSVVRHARRIVVKVGSSLVTAEGRGLDHVALSRWAEQIAALTAQGKEVVLVSSGAIAEGIARLGWKKRPKAINELQAAAAVGQMGLVQAYESIFRAHGLHAAQVLLTHEDLADRTRYLNARTTLRTLLALRVVPIINENDTVATDEIRLGDNDTLGALVTNLIEADCLIILTDQPGLYTADPRKDPQATLVMDAHAGDPELERMAGGARNVSFEGMRCATGERRLYAYRQPDGTWSRARNAQWEDIKLHSLLSYHKALYEDHFCPDGINVRDPREAVRNLRRAVR
jgi:glutamate 5-kinase